MPRLTPNVSGIWGLVDEHTPNSLVSLDQVFNVGLKIGKDREFLGYRPIISTNPLKFAPAYTWLTYGEVDLRRRYLGSAIHTLFQKGELGGGEYDTVGIWSPNRPGAFERRVHPLLLTPLYRMADN